MIRVSRAYFIQTLAPSPRELLTKLNRIIEDNKTIQSDLPVQITRFNSAIAEMNYRRGVLLTELKETADYNPSEIISSLVKAAKEFGYSDVSVPIKDNLLDHFFATQTLKCLDTINTKEANDALFNCLVDKDINIGIKISVLSFLANYGNSGSLEVLQRVQEHLSNDFSLGEDYGSYKKSVDIVIQQRLNTLDRTTRADFIASLPTVPKKLLTDLYSVIQKDEMFVGKKNLKLDDYKKFVSTMDLSSLIKDLRTNPEYKDSVVISSIIKAIKQFKYPETIEDLVFVTELFRCLDTVSTKEAYEDLFKCLVDKDIDIRVRIFAINGLAVAERLEALEVLREVKSYYQYGLDRANGSAPDNDSSRLKSLLAELLK